MKEMSIETLEIGNLIFGHSRGNYAIERSEWQEPFLDFLDKAGFDSYGYKKDDDIHDDFENDTFAIRPYYWGGDDDAATLPNFEYKPTGFTISWYKYPMRDSYASHDISNEEFFVILEDCAESLSQDKVVMCNGDEDE